jgi:hypothetical protein
VTRIALAAALALLPACSTQGSDFPAGDAQSTTPVEAAAPSCTSSVPSKCTTTPSYKTDIAPLVKRTCIPCHAPGGNASDRDFTTYAGLTRFGTTVLSQVNGCLMPPADAGPDAAMSSGDRTELLLWFVCGSPDN